MADDPVGISVGSVTVTVVPDAGDFARDLGAQISPQAAAVGEQIGQQLSAIIARSIQAGLRDGLKDAPLAPATESGSRTGGAFANAFKDRVNAALRDLPSPRVGVDATHLDAELADIRARLKTLGSVRIGVDLDETAALAEIELLHGRLVQLGLDSPEINVKVDTARALTELEAVKRLADSINSAPIADAERSLTLLPALTQDAADGFDLAEHSVSGLTTTIVALGPALVPLGAAFAGALAGGVTVLGALAGGLGVVALGAHGVAEAVAGEVTPALHELQATSAAGLLPGVEASIHSLLTLLPELDGFVGSLAHDIGGLGAEASAALTGPFWQEFYAFVSSEAGPILNEFGSILGNVAHGLAGLVIAFKPVTDEVGAGLVHLSSEFASFGGDAAGSSGFQSFLRYIETEGPVVVHVLGELFEATGHVLSALAPIGAVVLVLVGDFARLVSIIPTPAITALAAALGLLVTGLAAAKVAEVALDLVMDANPIILVGAAVVGLGTAFAEAYTHLKPFRDAVDDLAAVALPGLIPGLESLGHVLGFGGGTAPTSVSGTVDPSFGEDIAADFGVMTESMKSLLAIQQLVAQAFGDDTSIPKFVEHVKAGAVDIAKAAGDISDAITSAVRPAATTLSALTAELAAAEQKATSTEFSAIVTHQQSLDAAEYARSLAEVAKQTDAAALSAKQLADSMPEDTDADKAAKQMAEQYVAELAAQAKAEDAAAKAAQTAADRKSKAYQQTARAAQTATGEATAAAQALVANFKSSTDALLSQVSQFSSTISSGLTQGTDLSSIWQSLMGTDANGNPVNPTLTQVQTSLASTLKTVTSFTADLTAVAKAGGADSQGLITQILGLGDVNGDAFAKELLAAGATTIKGFSTTYSTLDKLTTDEGTRLAGTFYGAGVTSMENLAKGIIDQFPQLRSAIAPLIAELDAAFTITPTIKYNGSTGGGTAPGSGQGGNKNQPVGIGGTASVGDITVYATIGDDTILATQARVATGVVTQRATAAQQLQDAGMPGSSLDHLLAT